MKFIIWGGLILLALASATGLAANWIWEADLYFNHFRVQLLCASLIALLVVSLIGRRFVPGALAVVALNVALLGGRMIAMSPPDAHADGASLRILSLNLLAENKDGEAVLSLITQTDADVVVALEFTPDWAQALASLDETYSHSVQRPQKGYHGIAIWAKKPFDVEAMTLGKRTENLVGLRARFADVDVYGVHPKAPITERMWRGNRYSISMIADAVTTSGRPSVVVGDFNATAWSRAFKPLAQAGLKRTYLSPFNPTFPAGDWLRGIEIDHMLVKDVAARSRATCVETGSDHCAVIGEVWPVGR